MEKIILNKTKCILCNKESRPLFCIPKDSNRFSVWLKNIQKEDLLQTLTKEYIYNNGRLCTLHFPDVAFSNTLKLKLTKYAVPCLKGDRTETLTEYLDHASGSSLFLPKSNCSYVENHSNPEIVENPVLTAASSKVDERTIKTHMLMTNNCPEIVKKPFITPSSSSKTDKNKTKAHDFMNFSRPGVKDPFATNVTLCCRDRKEAIAFYRFLQFPKQRMRWIRAVKGKNLRPSRMTVVCPEHFSAYEKDSNSALKTNIKENAAPNTFPLHPLNQQKNKRLLQKWEEVIPVCHKEITHKGRISNFHCDSGTIEKIYVKIMWELPVSRILTCNEMMHSLQARTFHRPLPKHSAHLLQKTKKHAKPVARKKLKKSTALSSINFKEKKSMNISEKYGAKRMNIKNSLCDSENKKLDPVSSPSDIKTEEKVLNGSESDSEGGAEPIYMTSDNEDDTNNSQSNITMEKRQNAASSLKIINIESGIDPLQFQKDKKVEEKMSYKKRGSITLPNACWGITPTPWYIVCSKWNEFYDPIFRVVIEKDCNVKIFIKGRECVNENRKVSFENISSLLTEVDAYKICAGIDDKSMTRCMGHLENGSEEQFSVWCKGCQPKKKSL